MPRHRDWLRAGLHGLEDQAAAFNGVTDCCQDPNGWGDTRPKSSLERKIHAPMAACPPCVQGANRPRGLAISILELNQAILQEQRGTRHDREVTAAINHRLPQRRCMEVRK